jgi:sulfite reductase alpha subunit-like flavoprotein
MTYSSYEPGDVLELCPENPDEDVDRFLTLMRWDKVADVLYDLVATSEG